MIVDGAEGERGAIVIVRLAPDAAVLDDAGAGLEREDYRGEQRLKKSSQDGYSMAPPPVPWDMAER